MTAPTQTRITLKGLKVATFLSEETLAYSASVCLDGIKVADAQNAGHGGSTSIHPIPGQLAKFAEAEAFAKSLPAIVTEFDDPKDNSQKFTMQSDLELVIDGIACEMHERKLKTALFKRLMKKSLVLLENGTISTVKVKNPASLVSEEFVAKVRARYTGAQILNTLPEDAALTLFLTAAY